MRRWTLQNENGVYFCIGDISEILTELKTKSFEYFLNNYRKYQVRFENKLWFASP